MTMTWIDEDGRDDGTEMGLAWDVFLHSEAFCVHLPLESERDEASKIGHWLCICCQGVQ